MSLAVLFYFLCRGIWMKYVYGVSEVAAVVLVLLMVVKKVFVCKNGRSVFCKSVSNANNTIDVATMVNLFDVTFLFILK